ncbi:hypothetical protein PILCRDRAFT_92229 [Piloderma croceum F 1598]|uniref:Uncharacterized protein n=1 Tax=Piloderma croceum (strain F 1598) TaxID=765440 RepID=A0A0C3F5I4_PILCF|nr:hypothetical protein PILCRDRAFT_92229 [Piloderma croceum F 1598]
MAAKAARLEESTDGEGTSDASVQGVSGKRKKKSGKYRRKSKRSKKDPPPAWLTDGSPPELDLIIELCGIVSDSGLQGLSDLTQQLICPELYVPASECTLTLGCLISACAREDRMQTFTDFNHMILLVRLAFHLQNRSGFKIARTQSKRLNQNVTINLLVDSLVFALHNPEHSALSDPLITLMGATLIPQIPPTDNAMDFFDIGGMDALCDGFQTK